MENRHRHVTVSAGLWLALLVAEPAAAVCRGDCDGDLEVSGDEFRLVVEIALGRNAATLCPGIDAEGEVTIAELVGAATSRITGCPGAPTRTATPAMSTPTFPLPPSTATPTATPTPTSASATLTATPDGTVLPGCDNGSFTLSYSNAAGTNAETSSVDLGFVAANEAYSPPARRYNWVILGNECLDGVRFHRGVNLQMILQTTGITPGTYPLTPPFGNLLYQEIQDPNVFIRSWANVAGGSITIDAVEGNGFTFHLSAPMVPSTIVSFGSTPTGTFTLEVSGNVENIVR